MCQIVGGSKLKKMVNGLFLSTLAGMVSTQVNDFSVAHEINSLQITELPTGEVTRCGYHL